MDIPAGDHAHHVTTITTRAVTLAASARHRRSTRWVTPTTAGHSLAAEPNSTQPVPERPLWIGHQRAGGAQHGDEVEAEVGDRGQREHGGAPRRW